jgi:hypothetical protein
METGVFYPLHCFPCAALFLHGKFPSISIADLIYMHLCFDDMDHFHSYLLACRHAGTADSKENLMMHESRLRERL